MNLKRKRILFIFLILLTLIIKPQLEQFYSKSQQQLIKNVTITKNVSNLVDLTKCDVNSLKLNEYCNQTTIRLNTPNNDCTQCGKSIVYYHTIWQIESDKNDFQFRVLNLNLMSYLATQNLCCTKFLLWILRLFPMNKQEFLMKKYKKFKNIQIKLFSLEELCVKSSFRASSICLQKNSTQLFSIYSSIELSDFVRFFILDIYGGIYTDGDVIYLKNMQPFWYFNFAYRWSFTSNLNNAVIGLNNHSLFKNLLELIKGYSSTADKLLKNFNPFMLSYAITVLNKGTIFGYESFNILHSHLFDPIWLCNDGVVPRLNKKTACYFKEFISKEFLNLSAFDIDQFYPGAFTYHLHFKNLRARNFNKKSYFAYLELYFSSILTDMDQTIKL